MRRLLPWFAAPALALILYWPGLAAWFQKDDFAWLGLHAMIHDWESFWTVMFAPFAQGTIRTLSERIFYTGFHTLFGMNPLPYRIWVFLTLFAAQYLLTVVTHKLTGSRAAGFWAAILWTLNGEMAFVMAWTAIYYEMLCSLFLLAGLWLLVRYYETGVQRYWVAQWMIYLAGFLVLEQNVVYPALALVYVLCSSGGVSPERDSLWRRALPILPMFIPAAAYTVVHTLAAPLHTDGPYKMHWDLSVLSTAWTYWKWALGPSRLIMVGIYPSRWRSALVVALIAGLLGFLVLKLSRREKIAVLFPAWFLIVLAPLLPLKDHMSDYYLTIPLVGLAMWGAWALVCGWSSGWPGRALSVSLFVIYAAAAIPLGHANVVSFYDRSQRIRQVVTGVVEQARKYPGKTVVIDGADTDLFWSALYHRPLRLYGIDDVYLTPTSQSRIDHAAESEDARAFFLNSADLSRRVHEGTAQIYDVSGPSVIDVTGATK